MAAQTCSSPSLISRAGCTSGRIFAFERAARQRTQLLLAAADSSANLPVGNDAGAFHTHDSERHHAMV